MSLELENIVQALRDVSKATIATANQDTFTRILTDQIFNTEEILRDFDCNNYEYIGLAVANTDTSENNWSIVKKTLTGGKCQRVQFRSNISWNNRYQGW